MLYGGVRGRYLLTGARPNISSFTIEHERRGTELYDMNKYFFKVAFSVESIKDEGQFVPANDPDYVEWKASIIDSDEADTIIGVHKCNSEDFAEFHEMVHH